MRKKPGSKSQKRARIERDNFINHTVNQIKFNEIRTIGLEDLKGLKTGKSKNRSKNFRRSAAPWTYRQVIKRIIEKAQQNRVCVVLNSPQNTSRTCPICNTVSKQNRKGENFMCISCGFRGDSDYIGAHNILVKTLAVIGSLESPRIQKLV